MQELIDPTRAFVQQRLTAAEGGHDWLHTERVWRNAKLIATTEQCNPLIVELGALLHDIADSKFHAGDEEIGPRIAGEFLASLSVDKETIEHIQNIIRFVSFKGGHNDSGEFRTIELQIVQDADRLDAIGAIGIARTFAFGGFKHRAIFDADIPPNLNMTREEYKSSSSPSLNHFYEKLLLLKDLMNTTTGRQVARQRHDFMVQYLEQFHMECGGYASAFDVLTNRYRSPR